ncbi:FadR/GntR family transcriptional regulator [Nocardia pseudovaccinii]|uniref:FadR/GntR family transcriptional regulator n=1 Tax=Nocardia pseudovaccinii TaxID=189540 RepID=UPI000A4AEAE5|nr:FCD domain-containing protein [Nocardia pseudovaccinii]
MTDLAERMTRGGRGSRTERATEVIAELAENASAGAHLGTKVELQQRCGVAKSTFNEALRILQARGVITVRSGPGGGVFAAKPNPFVQLGNSLLSLDAAEADVADAVRIRDALDPLLIDDALEYCSARDISSMRAIVSKMRKAAADDRPVDFIRANWALHAAIAQVSPHTLMRSIYLSLLDVIESHTVSVLPTTQHSLPAYISERLRLHEELVEALAAGDRLRAKQLIDQHRIATPQPDLP